MSRRTGNQSSTHSQLARLVQVRDGFLELPRPRQKGNVRKGEVGASLQPTGFSEGLKKAGVRENVAIDPAQPQPVDNDGWGFDDGMSEGPTRCFGQLGLFGTGENGPGGFGNPAKLDRYP